MRRPLAELADEGVGEGTAVPDPRDGILEHLQALKLRGVILQARLVECRHPWIRGAQHIQFATEVDIHITQVRAGTVDGVDSDQRLLAVTRVRGVLGAYEDLDTYGGTEALGQRNGRYLVRHPVAAR